MNELDAFRYKIDNLDSSFDDADSVHDFGVYVDEFATGLISFLKANEIQSYSYSLDELLRALGVDDDIVDAASSLLEHIENRAYGESCLTADDVGEAEDCRNEIHKNLVRWCEEKMQA